MQSDMVVFWRFFSQYKVTHNLLLDVLSPEATGAKWLLQRVEFRNAVG